MMEEEHPIMELKDVRRHYVIGGHVVKALDGIDMSIRAGEFLMIVGSSGSGKSTLLNLLGFLDVPTSGSYRMRGELITHFDDRQLSKLRNRKIGFVFQQFNLLYDLTVLQNIALPLVYSGMTFAQRFEAARKYGELVGIGHRLDHRPTELSGGESQRVAIARSLVNEPEIILTDEPTGNLDSRTGREIMNAMHDLNKRGYTIVMVTHDRKYADEGSRRITLSDGRITAEEDLAAARAVAGEPERESKRLKKARVGDGGMSFFDLMRIGLREGLFAHKMRTALTMLGIVIAVAGVIAMSSFSLGSKKKQADQIRALGANMVRIEDSLLEGDKLSDVRIGGSRGLSMRDMDLVRSRIPGVVKAACLRRIKLNIAGYRDDLSARVIGVSGDYMDVNNLEIAEGRFIDEDDILTSARVAVIGHGIPRQLGSKSPIGMTLQLGLDPYTVVGVLANKQIDMKGLEATGVADSNYDVIIPLQTLLTRTRHLDLRSEVDEIHLQLETEDLLYEAGTSIRRLLSVVHGGAQDFQLVVPLDLLRQKQQAQKVLDVLTICISSIALIVGGIGIMNIMLASVTERIREIGIRRACGATKKDIMYQFLSESVLISVAGGIIGMLLAFGAVVVTCFALDLPVVVSFSMVCLAIGASTGTGLLFGLYPAKQAANKNPVEALHYE
jgi:macrolide transport system ATP-binding/permease protein